MTSIIPIQTARAIPFINMGGRYEHLVRNQTLCSVTVTYSEVGQLAVVEEWGDLLVSYDMFDMSSDEDESYFWRQGAAAQTRRLIGNNLTDILRTIDSDGQWIHRLGGEQNVFR